MLSAVDVPKSKSITITFMGLKQMLLGLMLCLSFSQVSPKQQCSDSLVTAVLVFKLFFILGALLDLFLLLIFLCTTAFNRMEYFIMFIFHVIFTGFTIIVCIVQAAAESDCSMKSTFLGGCLFLGITFIVSAVVVMWANMYFGLKFANFGCDIIWALMWITASSCGNVLVSLIGIIHGLLSMTGLLGFILLNFIGKRTFTAKFWKQMFAVSVFLMLFCYVLAWVGDSSSATCASSSLYILTYEKFGLLEIISPILLLIFLNTEMGDPRDNILRSEARVFAKNRQNQNFQIDDTN